MSSGHDITFLCMKIDTRNLKTVFTKKREIKKWDYEYNGKIEET